MGRIRRIAIVDDDAGVRDSIAQLIKERPRLRLVDECARAKDAVSRLPELDVELVLLDIRMPGMDGIECCYELRNALPDAAIAMFTGRRLPCFVNTARVAGADAFYWKGMGTDQLTNELELTQLRVRGCMRIGGGTLLGGSTGNFILNSDPRLSPKMEAILEREAQGLRPKEIGARLGCNVQTVYTQIHRGFDLLEASAECSTWNAR